MDKTDHKPEELNAMFRQVEVLRLKGRPTAETIRTIGVSDDTSQP